MVSPFASHKIGKQYVVLCVATFLCFLTSSTLTLLSVILHMRSFSASQIGIVLSSPGVPLLASLLVSGVLSRKFGPLRVMLAGQAITIVSFVLMEWGLAYYESAILLRASIGVGFGLYFTASMIYARQLLNDSTNLLYYFGIFTSMIPLPNALGPFVADVYLDAFGSGGFFAIMSIPCLLGIALLIWLINTEAPYTPADTGVVSAGSYKRVLVSPTFLVPGAAIFLVGIMWGFAVAYMALYLKQFDIAVGLFFSPLTLLLFLSRFGLIRYLQHLSTALLSFISFGLLGVSYLLIVLSIDDTTVVLSGLTFGLGYSLAFPLFSVWSTRGVEESDRPAAIALFNAFFHGGMFMTPLLVAVTTELDLGSHVLALFIVAVFASIVFFIAGRKAMG
ncbi:MFS transporter [Pusillimonas sp. TS35]|nr:MFS transporter [Pusillimonas sp. TS35]